MAYMAHILDHFVDYMLHDDRPDHGFGVLESYRYMPEERKRDIILTAVRVIRRYRTISYSINKNKKA